MLWNILQKLGCSVHFIGLISTTHQSVLRKELKELFEVRNREKQGCILAPSLFWIFLFMVLSKAFTDSTQRVCIQSRLEANLFNASQFKFTRKNQKCSCTWAHVCWWHCLHGTQPPRCTGINHLFLKICSGIWAEN